jgi:hypothetical protein
VGRKDLLGLPALLLCLGTYAEAQTIINASRRIDWSQAGVTGGIPNRSTICTTLNPGATASQINTAIASCASGQVVFLNAGTYSLSAGIRFNNKRNVTLRGAGPDRTLLVFSAGSTCGGMGADVCFINGDGNWAGDPRNVANWMAGHAIGATSITLTGATTLQVGTMLILDQLDDPTTDNGAIWVCQTISICAQQDGAANGRTGRAQEQLVRVTAISGNTVTITPGLYMPNWRSSQSPQAWWSNDTPISMSGIENLSLDHAGSGTTIKSGVYFYNAYNCWVKNVRSLNSNRNHVWLYQSAHITVRDSYFYGTANAASQSYGTEQFMSADNLVENNIFEHITAPMLNTGATGTVFGYNYAIDDYYGVSSTWQQSSSYHHAAGNSFFLWEGNDGPGLTADDIHGSSHFITAFRNVWLGWEPGKTQETIPIHLEAWNRYYNFVGNVLGKIGYHTRYEAAASSSSDAGNASVGDRSIYTLGYSGNEGTNQSPIPNDTLVKLTMMRWGNYDTVHASAQWNASEVPSSLSQFSNAVPGNQVLPNSLYLSAKPSWWAATPWPAIGADVSGGQDPTGHAFKIPAHACYDNTSKTSGILNFNAVTCYPDTVAPHAPTNVRIIGG